MEYAAPPLGQFYLHVETAWLARNMDAFFGRLTVAIHALELIADRAAYSAFFARPIFARPTKLRMWLWPSAMAKVDWGLDIADYGGIKAATVSAHGMLD